MGTKAHFRTRGCCKSRTLGLTVELYRYLVVSHDIMTNRASCEMALFQPLAARPAGTRIALPFLGVSDYSPLAVMLSGKK